MPVGISAYVPLATKTLTATAASVTFSSITQTYRDLVVVAKVVTVNGNNVYLRINSDAASTYWGVAMIGNGTAATSPQLSSVGFMDVSSGATPTATIFSQIVLNIMDYSATDKHKNVLRRADQSANGTTAVAHRWPSTAAINSLQFYAQTGNLGIGSTFTLYGIASV